MVVLILTVVLLAVLGWFIILVSEYLRKHRILSCIPSVEGERFLIGHGHLLKTDAVEFFNQVLEYVTIFDNDPLFTIWIGPHPMVICNHPESVEAILGSNEIINKSHQYRFLYPWLGLGLLTARGKKWRSRRKFLTPAFHFSMMQHYYLFMNENSRALIDVIENKLSSLTSGQTLDVLPLLTQCALDIICEAAMGYKLDSLHSCNAGYANAIGEMTDLVMQRMKKPFLHPDVLFSLTSWGRKQKCLLKIIHEFTRSVILERKTEREMNCDFDYDDVAQGKRGRLAFLDLLLHEQAKNGNISDIEIQEEVDTFMFEGHDTTTVAMSWCLYLIGLYPEVQAKIHNELDQVFTSGSCDVGPEHIGRLQYLDRVTKEALRLFPSVPYIARNVEKEYTLMNRKIPSGTTLMVMPSALHRNPQIFHDPLEFRPERFLPENCVKRHPYAYIPFSAGPRNCIGAKVAQLEEKIVLSWILRHYIIRSKQSFTSMRAAGEIILRPADGILLEFERRN